MKSDLPKIENPPELRHKMTEVARQFRKAPTKSEALLWDALRGEKLEGIKFRRQQPVGPFVVDFYNSVYRLVVEIDGSIHDSQFEADQERQNILEALGLHILRVRAESVENNLFSVLETIRAKITELQSHPNESPPPILGDGTGERG